MQAGFVFPTNFVFAQLGASLEDLLSSTVNNGHAPIPPASAEAIGALEDCEGAAGAQCAICLEAYEPGQSAKRMPCGHVFHTECLMPWLSKCNHTCPTCRRPVPAAATSASRGSDGEAAPPPAVRGAPAPPPADDFSALSIRELKARLDQLSISYAGVLERSELGALLRQSQRDRPRPGPQAAWHGMMPFFAAFGPSAAPFGGVHGGAAINPIAVHSVQFPNFDEFVTHQDERMLQEALARSLRD